MDYSRIRSGTAHRSAGAVSLIATALNLFAPQIGKVLEKVIPDTGKRDEIEREIRLAMLEQADTFNKQAGQIVLAEANSQHWLVAAWRPILMLTIIAIVAWNYLIAGIAIGIGFPVTLLELPPELWDLLTLGVGGYVVGRSGEKMVKAYKEK